MNARLALKPSARCVVVRGSRSNRSVGARGRITDRHIAADRAVFRLVASVRDIAARLDRIVLRSPRHCFAPGRWSYSRCCATRHRCGPNRQFSSTYQWQLYRVQRLLGHANAKATQRYAHLAPEALADAAEAMGNVVRPILERASNARPKKIRVLRPNISQPKRS
jgi:integrase